MFRSVNNSPQRTHGGSNIELPLVVNPDDTIQGQGDTVKVSFTKVPVKVPLMEENIVFRNLYEPESCKGEL